MSEGFFGGFVFVEVFGGFWVGEVFFLLVVGKVLALNSCLVGQRLTDLRGGLQGLKLGAYFL